MNFPSRPRENSPDENKKYHARRHILTSAVLMLLWLATLSGCGKKQKATPPPPVVQVVTVTPRDVPIYSEWIGTLDGYVNAQIRAQVTGYLLTQGYTEGSEVKMGDLLFQIDPRPFQATLDQAKGNLAQAQAQQVRTELDVKRYAPLAKVSAISQQEYDNAVQSNLVAKASVQAAQAAVESANLNLGFTKVISPIDGLAGLAQAQIGDLVGPGGNPLTTVSTINPIKVYFPVSEQQYIAYRRQYSNEVERAQHEKELEFQMILADGSIYPHPGKFFFAERQVNVNTGTLQIVGLFPNPDFTLRPGLYARVRARTQIRKGAVMVPQRAVMELQGSYQVVIVDNQNKAHIRPVTVGEQVGADWIIEKGLQAGDRVVAEGTLKAKEGVTVNPQPYAAPATTNNPTTNQSTGR
ncbi:MAG: efflux transporter, family, subunit [Pedosphaera sp.]|nr:efflux transporter, family, subunit [Pedosphaera sp.]